MMVETGAQILTNSNLIGDIFKLKMRVPEIAAGVRAGQFVHLEVPGFSLRRPFTVADADDETISLVIRRRGPGTQALAQVKPGAVLGILGPLGNGFTPGAGPAFLLGGGIGTAALTLLARQLGTCTLVMGGRTQQELWLEDIELPASIKIEYATEDGSRGYGGNLVQYAKAKLPQEAWVAACGPEPMLAALQKLLCQRGLSGQFALEARMACGLGACLGCTCKTTGGNARVCKDGPVFAAREVVFQ